MRNMLMLKYCLILLFVLLSYLGAIPMKSDVFYIAACGEEGGIYAYVYDDELVKQVGFYPIANANYMAVSPDKKYMFVSVAGAGTGGVASFKVNADKSLTLLSEVYGEKMGACHLTTNPEGTLLFAANYPQGRLAQYPVKDGVIAQPTLVIQHEGKGPHPNQKNAHAHFTIVSPDKKYLCVVDLGMDAIMAYRLHVDGVHEGDVKATKIVPPGSGPRHLVFTSDGKRAYLLNELASTVTSLTYSDGEFKPVQTVPMLPGAYKGFNGAAAIRLSADEKYLFASNRGYDSIVTYNVLEDGVIAQADLMLCAGSFPRDFNFLSAANKFAIGHEKSGTVFFYSYDAPTGHFTPDGNRLENLPKPIAIFSF